MIIADVIEHDEAEEEQIYLLREEKGLTVVYVMAVIDGELRSFSKAHRTREEALKEIREIESILQFKQVFH